MNQINDSKTLFTRQVRSHVAALCDLLGCETMVPAPVDVTGRSKIATHMMAGTFSLMGHPVWDQLLNAYEGLLDVFCEKGLPWDDRIAQVTSELIDREETLTGTIEADVSVNIEDAVALEMLEPLRDEINVLRELFEAVAVDNVENVPVQPRAEEPVRYAEPLPEPRGPVEAVESQPQTVIQAGKPGFAGPMGGVVEELKKTSRSVVEGLESGAYVSRDWNSPEIAGIRDQLSHLSFYVCSIQQMIERNNPPTLVQNCGLAPLRTVLTDFANEISESGVRSLEIVVTEKNVKVDPGLLPIAGAILQRMITDVFNRSEGESLRITVDVYEHSGALRWRLSDDGDNFITDSQLDHEDQLAFYPGLRTARKLLSRYNGVLWVEPRDDHEVRFEFSLPGSKAENTILSWGEGARAFGVRAVQLCELLSAASAPRGKDTFGEFLTLDSKRVPLLKLDVLYAQAPADGDNIAVVGSLERRIAFYVPGRGERVEGKELEDVVPFWQGPAHVVAQVGDKRIALLDADQIIEEFMDRTGDMNNEEESGGVVEEESRESNSQAMFDSEVNTPPDHLKQEVAGKDVQVLVVEQSESLRAIFAEMLERSKISVAFAADVDQAAELIQTSAPQLIISEFRMPTMAAKVLVETLDNEDRDIPVLVTTSQSGKTADLLVEKLGVAGYLSKPLDQEEIVSRLGGFLADRARA
jgi:CheY-like chemotaxis protein